ncbi:TPA: hypothetical protein ACJIWU_004383 [Enterobacter chengduensis]|uniref:Uncharacterized protein n=1 Tax=Enterobacter chengduensis TaxID=2494701 RepID=A0AAW3HGA8_9ENTR|nr:MULTISPECIES: hypothetical protein [Enterobacter]KDF47432.1 hypothetical protein AE07_02592 [Enterobacter cloacae BWH 43]OTW35958.1 hypothetical protein CAP57_05930 [Enterobacter kobei]HAT2781368.1 hypothetical protein [Citrobacter koseri]KJX35571.1 hypothetical protein SG71_13510 [Enterobacter chengduensis]MBN9878541.1 hypothetical protein [Enterobacter chengduensis]
MLNNLESLPSNDEFLWADFLEIRSMVHPDKAFSRGDLDSVMRAQPEEFNREQSSAKWRLGTDFIRQRINIFGDSYPFSLSADGDTLSLENYDDLENIKKLYLSLLICANIKYIPLATRPTITRSFELISLPIFTSLMPRGYQVYPNWAGGGADARYTGLLIEKYQAIARDIRCETTTFKPRDFKPRDSGDGGIDIVAWHPFGDERDAIPAAFVQCGCSKDEWRHKQLEPSYAKLGSKMPVTHPWASYYFLPQDLRWMDGDWAYKADIGGAILVDRLRLINLARENELIDALPPTPYVDDAVSMSYR